MSLLLLLRNYIRNWDPDDFVFLFCVYLCLFLSALFFFLYFNRDLRSFSLLAALVWRRRKKNYGKFILFFSIFHTIRNNNIMKISGSCYRRFSVHSKWEREGTIIHLNYNHNLWLYEICWKSAHTCFGSQMKRKGWKNGNKKNHKETAFLINIVYIIQDQPLLFFKRL